MAQKTKHSFKWWQWQTIIVTLVGYALFYFVRKNFSVAMPSLEAEFGISKVELGLFLTLHGIVYGLSRFVNGFVSDRGSARVVASIGLGVCALINIFFAFSETAAEWIASLANSYGQGWAFASVLAYVMGIMWVINGYFQGMGVPPFTKTLTQWIAPNELATKMSIWNMSHSIGAGLVFGLCGIVIMGYMGINHSDDKEWVELIANNKHKSTVTVEAMQATLPVEPVVELVAETEAEPVAEVEPVEAVAVAEPAPKSTAQIVEEWYVEKYGDIELMQKAITVSNEKIAALTTLLAEAKSQNSSEVTSLEENLKTEEEWLKAVKSEAKFRQEWLDEEAKAKAENKPEELPKFVKNVVEQSKHVGAWRYCFLFPAIFALLGAFGIFFLVKNSPSDMGFPEIMGGKKNEVKTPEQKAEYNAFIRRKVFGNRLIWTLALANFFIYVVRFAALDWGPTLLTESKGMSLAIATTLCIVFEFVGGNIGMVVAGWLTDHLFKNKAHRTCLFCSLGAAISVAIFWFIPADAHWAVQMIPFTFIGFFVYGPQALLGVAAANQATNRAAATANGILGIFGYASTILSGVGFGYIAQTFGWDGAYVTILVMSLLSALTLLTMWTAKADGYDR